MSEVYVSYVDSQSSRINIPQGLEISERCFHEPWVPRQAVEWTQGLQRALLGFFTKLSYPFRSYDKIPFKDPLRSEIRRFLLALDAYIESPHPVVPYRDILYGATQLGFSTYLKRVKRKSFETTWRVEHFEFPAWWNDVPSYRITDIGDIFNYNYLIFWKEDSDDYKWGNVPVNINPDTLSLFKSTLLDILPEREEFEKIDPSEVLLELSPSISLDSKKNQKSPHYLIKNRYLTFSKERHITERCVIPVGPENIRDSIINDPSDLNTISLIDRQAMEVLRVMPGHIHLRNKDEVSRRYRKLYKKCTYFLHRDIRKEGITKPRELLKVILEALYEKYPDISIFGYTSFYDKLIIRDNGQLIYPDRGHGLGMANSLTTLMQLAIHQMTTDALLSDMPLVDSRVLCINDDFVAGFQSEYHMESYWDKESELMELLSIIRAPEKSFSSYKHFVLAERYFTPDGEYEKISYQRRELLLPLACANVTHAKEQYKAAQVYVNSTLVQLYMSEIRTYWGYEFYPTEFTCPSVVGGWINEHINSVDLSLLTLDQLDIKSYHYRGFKASQRKLQRKRSEKFFTPPIISLWGNLNIPNEFQATFDILPMNILHDRYGRYIQRSSSNFKHYWQSLYKVRQKTFKKPYDITYNELLKEIIASHPTSQFYPCESMIACYHKCNIIRANIEDIYIDPNPKMALLAKYNSGISATFKEDFSICFSDLDIFQKQTIALFSKEVQRSLKSETTCMLGTGRYSEIYTPEGDYRPEEQYLNPVRIGSCVSFFDWGKGFPELKPGFEHPLIDRKRSVYNRLFSINELYLLNRSGLPRDKIKLIADHMNSHPHRTLEDILYYLGQAAKEILQPELKPSPPRTTVPDNIITVEDLMGEGGYKFWSYRQNREGWVVESPELVLILSNLGWIVTTFTYSEGALKATGKKFFEEQKHARNADLFLMLGTRLGVFKLMAETPYIEDTLPEEGLGGLFDEG